MIEEQQAGVPSTRDYQSPFAQPDKQFTSVVTQERIDPQRVYEDAHQISQELHALVLQGGHSQRVIEALPRELSAQHLCYVRDNTPMAIAEGYRFSRALAFTPAELQTIFTQSPEIVPDVLDNLEKELDQPMLDGHLMVLQNRMTALFQKMSEPAGVPELFLEHTRESLTHFADLTQYVIEQTAYTQQFLKWFGEAGLFGWQHQLSAMNQAAEAAGQPPRFNLAEMEEQVRKYLQSIHETVTNNEQTLANIEQALPEINKARLLVGLQPTNFEN